MGMKSQTQPVVDIESQKDDRIRKHNHSFAFYVAHVFFLFW